MRDVYAVVLAAGKGKRMGTGINKQFIKLNDMPILVHTLKAFEKNKNVKGIVLVTARDEVEFCKSEIIEKYNITKICNLVIGGKERQHSVYNGLAALHHCDVVLIHDGARPFVNDDMIDNGIKYAEQYGACACGVPPKDTIKIKDDIGFGKETPNRESLFVVQTPQCFKYDLILNCHKKLQNEEVLVTDDSMVAEKYGHKVYLYEGSYNNIKITTKEDIAVGEQILKEESPCK